MKQRPSPGQETGVVGVIRHQRRRLPSSTHSPAPVVLVGAGIGTGMGLIHLLPVLLWVPIGLLLVFVLLVVPTIAVALGADPVRSARAQAILLVLLNFFLALRSQDPQPLREANADHD